VSFGKGLLSKINYNMTAKLLGLAISGCWLILLGRCFEKADAGIMLLNGLVYLFFMVVANFGLFAAIFKFLPTYQSIQQKRQLVGTTFYVFLLVGGIIALIYIALRAAGVPWLIEGKLKYMHYYLMFCFCHYFVELVFIVLAAEMNFKSSAMMYCGMLFAERSLAICLGLTALGIKGLLLGFIFGSALFAAIGYWRFLKPYIGPPAIHYDHIRTALPYYVREYARIIAANIDQAIVAHFFPLHVMGAYYMCNRIYNIFNLIIDGFRQPFMIRIVGLRGSLRTRKYFLAFALLAMAVALTGGALMWIFDGTIMSIFGQKYVPYQSLLKLFAILVVCTCAHTVMVTTIFIYFSPRPVMVFAIITATFSVVFQLAGYHLAGYQGVVLGSAAAYAANATLMLIYSLAKSKPQRTESASAGAET